MAHVSASMVVAGCLAGLVGCAAAAGAGAAGAADGRSPSSNAVVLSSEQLWERSTDLLTLIAMRVSALQVRRAGSCPEVTLRGRTSLVGPNDAVVYVDGTRATNTCVLEMMRSDDVARVEIYPMGVSGRPGYAPSPTGLILIFLRTGEPDAAAEPDSSVASGGAWR